MKASGAHINERENGAAFGRNKLARGLKCGGAAKGQRRSMCLCMAAKGCLPSSWREGSADMSVQVTFPEHIVVQLDPLRFVDRFFVVVWTWHG